MMQVVKIFTDWRHGSKKSLMILRPNLCSMALMRVMQYGIFDGDITKLDRFVFYN